MSEGAEIELLLFEVGGEVYGADASQVLRVDRASPSARAIGPLGRPSSGDRALVVRSGAGEVQLRVDRVLEVTGAEVGSLRRLPPAATHERYAIGVWLDRGRPVLLLDLAELAA